MQIQLTGKKSPVGKIFFLNWKKKFLSWIIIFFQLGNSGFPFRCVFVRFYPCFCLFREVRRNMVGLKNIYKKLFNDEQLMFVGTYACRPVPDRTV